MSPAFVMTSAWWLEASPRAAWQLMADARQWPRWWRAVQQVRRLDRRGRAAGRFDGWRALAGARLHLRVAESASEPFQLVEWQIEGDIRATLTCVVSSAPAGSDVTCRWEVKLPPGSSGWLRTLGCLLLARSLFGRMRMCAHDMGTTLGCRSARLREWSGLTRR